MDGAEFAAWTEQNRIVYQKNERAKTPCHDCIASFALEMRSEGRCDGHPRGVEDDAPPSDRYYGFQSPLRLNAEVRHAEREVRKVAALAMFSDGMSRKDIAAAMGVRHNTVCRYLLEAA